MANTSAATTASLTAAEKRALLQKILAERTAAPAAPEMHPLSITQQRLWFFEQVQPGTAIYNNPLALRMAGRLDVSVLQRVLKEIVRRHKILRTGFPAHDGQPVQYVHPAVDLPFEIVDVSAAPDLEAAIGGIIRESARKPFDIATAPLARFTLIRSAADRHELVLTTHQLVCDGWSVFVMLRELIALYAEFALGRPSPLPPLRVQYTDLARRQRERAGGPEEERHLQFWLDRLSGSPPVTELPPDRPRPAVQGYRGRHAALVLAAPLRERLIELSKAEGATLFMTLLAALDALIARHTGQDDLVIGVPVAGRVDSDAEPLIGSFVNTVAMRADLSGDPSFKEVLARVKRTCLDAYAHQDVPFERVLERLGVPRDPARPPVFQILFNMLNLPHPPARDYAGLKLDVRQIHELDAKFDLTFYVHDSGSSLHVDLVYNEDLYQRDTVTALLARYERLLQAVAAERTVPVGTVPLWEQAIGHVRSPLPAADGFEPFARDDVNQSIPGRFARQVRARPHHPAVIGASRRWSYLELDRASDAIARRLLEIDGAGPSMVGLFCGHDAPMIAAMIGALKAGKSYVPLDPSFPAERLHLMLRDSGARVIVADHVHRSVASAVLGKLATVIGTEDQPCGISTAPLPVCPADALAYLLYTSGSTGAPKGVMQNHRNVLHFIGVYANNLRVRPADRLSLVASYGFDAAVMDIYAALLMGATLVLKDVKREGVESVSRWIEQQRITVFHSTPTLFRHAFPLDTAPALLTSVRAVVMGGEEVHRSELERFGALFPADSWFVNGLGPTESTVTLQQYLHAKEDVTRPTIPVGLPVDDTEVLLLDRHGRSVDLFGEIAIRSAHVALGYWQQPELTARAFSDVGDGSGRRMYRTGDLGRRLTDGRIEFAGRRDSQVKIRGIRIELGELEAVLGSHPDVADAAVVSRPDPTGDLRLAAYVTRAGHAPFSTRDLRQWLKDRLPEFTIPASITVLEAFPLTDSGKINRGALPEPVVSADLEPDGEPTTPLEGMLVAIWADVLGVPHVGIHDDFFALGGHSLLAARMTRQLSEIFWIDLPIRTLFDAPTCSKLAEVMLQHLERKQAGVAGARRDLIELNTRGTRPPFWFLHAALQGDGFYCFNLAKHLGEDQPVYALAPLGLDGSPVPPTIEDMAREQLRKIRNVQPKGPYYLGGFCVSGVVAYEAARQLRAAGERVELVVLMESRVHPPDTVNRMIDRVATSVAAVFRLSPRQRLRLVIGARPKVRKLHAAYQMGARKLASTIRRRVSSWRATGASPLKGPALTRPEITGADAVRRAVAESNSLAAHGFFVREYSGRVCCLWAQDEPFWPEIWQSVAPQVELHPVPGNHNTCITTQITSLGTRIREALHRAQEEAAAASANTISGPVGASVAAGPTASGPTPIAAAKSRFVSTTASL